MPKEKRPKRAKRKGRRKANAHDWRAEYIESREKIAPWVDVRTVFPRKTRPTYADVRKVRRYLERLATGIARQPTTILRTRDAEIAADLRRQFPQPRLQGLRGIIVPAQQTGERVRARRTKRGTELTYERTHGAIARRFVRIPVDLIVREDVDGLRRLLARAWKNAKTDRYTVAMLALKDGLESQWDSLVQDSTGLARLQSKAAEIVSEQGNYRDPEKWFRGIHFLKESGRKRSPRRAGGRRREQREKSRAEKQRARRKAMRRAL